MMSGGLKRLGAAGMGESWLGWARVALAAAGLAAAAPAFAAADDGWTMEKPTARRETVPSDGLPPIVETGTADAVTDPPPPGSPPLKVSAPGVTALAGRVLDIAGAPLIGVEVRIGLRRGKTDSNGLFLLENLRPGHDVLIIDGRPARLAGADKPVDHGIYEARVKVEAHRTTQLAWVSWLPVIDHSHDVDVPEVLDKELTVSNPNAIGIELKIPAGAVLTGLDGERVRKLGITKSTPKRTPFPMAPNHTFTFYATFQPGGTTISGAHGQWLGAQVTYDNSSHMPVNARAEIWTYNPDGKGWGRYGYGKVSADGQRIEGEPGAQIYALTGVFAPINPWPPFPTPPGGCPPVPTDPGPSAPPAAPPCPTRIGSAGDPVDVATGLFIMDRTDMHVDDVMPIDLRRVYRPDPNPRAFGTGMSLSYDMFFVEQDTGDPGVMYMADGSALPFVPTQPPNDTYGYQGGSWITHAPGPFYNSTIVAGNPYQGWILTRPDGYTFYFPNDILSEIVDPNGNQVSIERDSHSRATTIVSPNGRHINLSYNNNSQVSSASDDLGRTVTYNYAGTSNLQNLVDADAQTTTYGWDASNRLQTVTYPNSGKLTNVYDANNRVTGQTQPDGKTWGFVYTLNASNAVTATSVTDPRGNVENYTLSLGGQVVTDVASLGVTLSLPWRPVSDVKAAGSSLQSAYSLTLDPMSQLPSFVTDPLGRVTGYTYDAAGRTLTSTQLSGTSNAVTSTYTYAWPSGKVATITDPLGHQWIYARSASGNLTAVTDPLSLKTSYTYDAQGHVLTATDPASDNTTYNYANGDFTSLVDPLGRTSKYFEDTASRLNATQNPLGALAKQVYDPLYGPTKLIDPNGNATTLAYGLTGKLASVTDAKSGKVASAYDAFDRLSTYTDALTHVATINSRDGLGEILQATDRKGQVANFTYDALNRPATATYADGSNVTYTFDLGGRLTKVVDSLGGTITRVYDGLDRMTSETTAQGTVTYTYDAANRLTSIQSPGQALATYGYDNDNRLTSIVQGSVNVAFGYDNASRRTSATLPNGITAAYVYDAASELTSITYKASGGATLGTLTYGYALDGTMNTRSGTLFTSVLPAAVTSAAYNASNQLTSRVTSAGTQSPTWDLNGSLLNDGLNAYTWDARNRLKSLGSLASFVYDAFGRRVSVTKSSATTSYLYSNNDVLQESGATTANLLLGLGVDERLSYNGSTYLTDLLGSTVGLSTGSAIQTSFAYDPYGTSTVAGTSTTNTFGFTGRENDATTAGLMFYRARYYNPAWSRFVSEDPIGINGGVNLYGYVNEQPTRWVDWAGLAAGGRFTVPCGRCTLTYDSDQFKGPHTHWNCPGMPQGCIKKDGQLCDGSSEPSEEIKQCLRDRKRVPPNYCLPSDPLPNNAPSAPTDAPTPPWIWMLPLIPLIPFPGNPLYGGI